MEVETERRHPMSGWRSRVLVAFPLGALVLTSCHHTGTESCYPAPPVRTAGILPAHPLTPCQACTIPPAGAPPMATLNPPTGGFAPLPAGPDQSGWGPSGAPSASLGGPVP